MVSMRNEIVLGDCLEVLRTLPDGCVQTCVTSPPYWGLRDYGTAEWDGGDAGCDHVEVCGTTRGGLRSTLTGGQDTSPHKGQYRNVCAKCGAVRKDQQLGLEPTPEQYVERMVEIFGEVKRVLRDDGTLWLNLGTSFISKTIQSDEWELRDDLTDQERAYVLSELAKHYGAEPEAVP